MSDVMSGFKKHCEQLCLELETKGTGPGKLAHFLIGEFEKRKDKLKDTEKEPEFHNNHDALNYFVEHYLADYPKAKTLLLDGYKIDSGADIKEPSLLDLVKWDYYIIQESGSMVLKEGMFSSHSESFWKKCDFIDSLLKINFDPLSVSVPIKERTDYLKLVFFLKVTFKGKHLSAFESPNVNKVTTNDLEGIFGDVSKMLLESQKGIEKVLSQEQIKKIDKLSKKITDIALEYDSKFGNMFFDTFFEIYGSIQFNPNTTKISECGNRVSFLDPNAACSMAVQNFKCIIHDFSTCLSQNTTPSKAARSEGYEYTYKDYKSTYNNDNDYSFFERFYLATLLWPYENHFDSIFYGPKFELPFGLEFVSAKGTGSEELTPPDIPIIFHNHNIQFSSSFIKTNADLKRIIELHKEMIIDLLLSTNCKLNTENFLDKKLFNMYWNLATLVYDSTAFTIDFVRLFSIIQICLFYNKDKLKKLSSRFGTKDHPKSFPKVLKDSKNHRSDKIYPHFLKQLVARHMFLNTVKDRDILFEYSKFRFYLYSNIYAMLLTRSAIEALTHEEIVESLNLKCNDYFSSLSNSWNSMTPLPLTTHM